MNRFARLSRALPAAFVERGCAVLRPLLAAADDAWAEQAAQRLPGGGALSLDFVERVVSHFGRQSLLAAAGGTQQLAHPEMLPRLLWRNDGGTRQSLADWLKCALDLKLSAITVRRESIRSALRRAHVKAIEGSRSVEHVVVAALLRELLPAHVEVREQDITIIATNASETQS